MVLGRRGTVGAVAVAGRRMTGPGARRAGTADAWYRATGAATLKGMADIFDVIADGTRRDILGLLRECETPEARGMSVSEIVAHIGVSQPTVSKHLKVLRGARLVVVREQGQRRFYRLHAEPLDAVRGWVTPFAPARPASPDEDATGSGGSASVEDRPDETTGRSAARPVALPRPAARVADAVGHAAASAVHRWEGILQKLPGR